MMTPRPSIGGLFEAHLTVADMSRAVAFSSTLESARRRGIGTALVARLVHDAVERGCTTATLQSTPMAERVCAAVGFRDLRRFLEYAPQAHGLRLTGVVAPRTVAATASTLAWTAWATHPARSEPRASQAGLPEQRRGSVRGRDQDRVDFVE
jgi:GNAT superfamily N-acetyltransferase